LLDDLQTHNNVNFEIGLVIHHTYVDRFCREKILHQELQPNFDDGLLTCCGFKCRCFGFAVNYHLCQILFDSVVMNLDLPPQFTISLCAATHCLFLHALKKQTAAARTSAHFFAEPIFLSTFSCFSNLCCTIIVR
jgi:hypothetical protein